MSAADHVQSAPAAGTLVWVDGPAGDDAYALARFVGGDSVRLSRVDDCAAVRARRPRVTRAPAPATWRPPSLIAPAAAP